MTDRTFPPGTPMEKVLELLIPHKEYCDRVIDYLDYIGYDMLVMEFEPTQVAMAINNTAASFHEYLQSPRICALTIFGLTWTMQVVPHAQGRTIQ